MKLMLSCYDLFVLMETFFLFQSKCVRNVMNRRFQLNRGRAYLEISIFCCSDFTLAYNLSQILSSVNEKLILFKENCFAKLFFLCQNQSVLNELRPCNLRKRVIHRFPLETFFMKVSNEYYSKGSLKYQHCFSCLKIIIVPLKSPM